MKARFTLSIDWEDFSQLFGKYHYGIITQPKKDIDRQTDIILDMLEETGNKATFFILGMLADYRPDLVKRIAAQGHEMGIHGQNHEQLFTLTDDKVREDIRQSRDTVEQITGQKVFGYRAPIFSILSQNLHALEILSELGLEYDSSIFPIKMPRYGIDGFSSENRLYQLPNGKQIVELPLTYATYFGKKLPVAGGGYVRLMPKWMVNKVYNKLEREGANPMVYMHPYEFDTKSISVTNNYPDDARYSRVKTMILDFKWNLFRQSIRGKIKSLLQQHTFITCKEKADYVKSNGNSPVVLGRP
jgi:polysaccharide deacetylase family protein (PEP-CTERM system associated)